jgi:phage terminase large subunit-like protein
MATMAGAKDSLLWLEWSAPMGCSLDDMSAWQSANPALGRTIHIDNLMATKNEPEAVVRTECLCQFVETLQSPWSPAAWTNCADLELSLEPGKPTYFAFDITPRRNHAALVGAQVLDDGKIAVGLVQEWKSETSIDDLEMANGVADWCRSYDVTEIQFSKNTGSAVASRLNAGGILAKAIDGRDFALACDQLLNAMEAGRLRHGDQQVLNRHIASSARINFADGGWIIGRRASNENVTAAVATAMVVSVATRQYSDIDIVVV